MAQNGTKYDNKKDMWHLLPFKALDYVVKTITFGAVKYGENDWQKFISRDNNERRYFSACMRHLSAWRQEELLDKETKLPHLSHAICCLLFVLWNDIRLKRYVKKQK